MNCTSTPLRASTGVSPGFALPPPRSPGFWSHGCDSRPLQTPPLTGYSPLRACRFPYGFGADPLSLATAVNSPARVSRRKARPRSPLLVLPGRPGFLRRGSPLTGRAMSSRAVSGSFHPLSQGAFQLSLTVLSALSVSGRI